MSRPNPPAEYLIRAWELRCEGRTLKYIAARLTDEFGVAYGRAVSTELARQWIPKGAELMLTEEARRVERWRALADLDQVRTWIQDQYDQGAMDVDKLAQMMHANVRQRAAVLGFSRLPKARVVVTDERVDPEPDPATAAAIAEAIAEADAAFARDNGRAP